MTAEPAQTVVEQLRKLGEPGGHAHPWRERPSVRDYPAELGLTEADIPQLIAVVRRWALPAEELEAEEAEEPGVYAPIHAWRALGQLRAVAAVEPMLAMLDALDERMDDWSLEEFPVVWALIGEPVLEPLGQYLANRAPREYSHICVVSGLRKLAQRHPDTRERVVDVLTRQLDDPTAHTPVVNGFLVSGLIDLHATESIEAMERAYAAEAVDLTICGNWATVRAELGVEGVGLISEDRAHASPPPLLPGLDQLGPPVGRTSLPRNKDRHRNARKRERRNRRRARRR